MRVAASDTVPTRDREPCGCQMFLPRSSARLIRRQEPVATGVPGRHDSEDVAFVFILIMVS